MADETLIQPIDPVRLTRREVEILALVIEGYSSKQVADLLFISKRTVDFHLDNVYGKLNVKNKMQALQRATRLGLLPRVV
jgi:LuxR family maltose regulon positive regulatory protein